MRVDKRIALHWKGEGEAFEGGVPGKAVATIDGDGVRGPSPTEALLLGLAGCMAIDVLEILRRGRVRVDSLEVVAEGERREEAPRRFTRIRLVYRLEGPGAEDGEKVRRAIRLSRDKYCSVLHSLRSDIEIQIETVPT